MRGTVFNIQRFSLYDGPGVRTVIFLKGCPLRCVWCHNPEGLEKSPQLLYDSGKCIGCGECVPACPNGCHDLVDGLHFLNRENCVSCGKCANACPSEALSVAGRIMTVDEVMEQVMRDESLYRRGNGGMTLSGGEPLYQPEFALDLLRAAKEAGISACIETCGAVSPETIEKAAELADVFLYDYKASGESDHKAFCGVSQKPILENLSLLDRLGAHVILRCPIVPGMNEKEKHISGIANTAKLHTSVREIHLEPYHRLGKSKSLQLGIADAFDTGVPDKNRMAGYRETIEALSGKTCKIN